MVAFRSNQGVAAAQKSRETHADVATRPTSRPRATQSRRVGPTARRRAVATPVDVTRARRSPSQTRAAAAPMEAVRVAAAVALRAARTKNRALPKGPSQSQNRRAGSRQRNGGESSVPPSHRRAALSRWGGSRRCPRRESAASPATSPPSSSSQAGRAGPRRQAGAPAARRCHWAVMLWFRLKIQK